MNKSDLLKVRATQDSTQVEGRRAVEFEAGFGYIGKTLPSPPNSIVFILQNKHEMADDRCM